MNTVPAEARPLVSAPRRLIINADDFGKSREINEAVLRAHREGVLTTASVMVNEPGFPEAVSMSKDNPRLGVGLHLTLVHGHSALDMRQIPHLVNQAREFGDAPASSGFQFFFDRRMRSELRDEIHAQFDRFHRSGLALDHVNGHLHLHLHPVIFDILMDDADQLGIQRIRLTHDPLRLGLQLSQGRYFYRLSHAIIFGALSARARSRIKARGYAHTAYVFGLLQTALVHETYVLALLSRLPPGDSELYSHPCILESRHEFEALISPKVKGEIERLGISLIRYRDL